MSSSFQCPHCLRDNFKTERGLEQHLNTHSVCSQRQRLLDIPVAALKVPAATSKHLAATKRRSNDEGLSPKQKVRGGLEGRRFPIAQNNCENGDNTQPNVQLKDSSSEDEQESHIGYENIFPPLDDDSVELDDKDNVNDAQMHLQCNDETLRSFKAYAAEGKQHFGEFTRQEKAGIKLMDTLQRKKAPLDAYKAVMKWHIAEVNLIRPEHNWAEIKGFHSRESLMKTLCKRYNVDYKNFVPTKNHVLPSSKTKLSVVWHDSRELVASLLMDPRLEDEDFLFFDNNPLAPPPEKLEFIADINTGTSYRDTYKKLITKPRKQILCPIIMYIDGAVTGQYDKLEVTALKMTLGIFNRKARDKEFLWRTLGYVPNWTKETSRGKKIFQDSGHIAAETLVVSDGEGEDEDEEEKEEKEEFSKHKAQDFHYILDSLLQSYREMEKETMLWDLPFMGKLYKNVELVFYLAFVKSDTVEADKLCGKYGSRTGKVSQLCRYCTCPTDQSDDPSAKYPYKTEAQIKRLVDGNFEQELKKLSQNPIKNAFHGLRFGMQNKRGIHGATPLELLHAVLLGTFMRIRDCFFAQIGQYSKSAAEINSLSKIYGKLLTRQSDRDLPKTNFAKGIQKGKIMAKEYSGVLLVMAAILQSTYGQEILSNARGGNFSEQWLIDDWVLVVETLLQWESFLKLDEMEVKHVKRLEKKHRFLMYLIKKVGDRTKGMGWKIVKFHAILHIALDILMFGVPINVDTGSNESHHKRTKVAAKLTQKNPDQFEVQTDTRLEEFHLVDIAMAEIESGRKLWKYFEGYSSFAQNQCPNEASKGPNENPEHSTVTGGSRIRVYLDEDDGKVSFTFCQSRMQNQTQVKWSTMLVEYLYFVQEEMKDYFPELEIRTEHKRNGQIFRGHPHFRGQGAWNDWVMIDWGDGVPLPCEIWCFLDLTELPEGVEVQIGEVIVEKGVYAVVESSNFLHVAEDATSSDMFNPIRKEVERNPDGSYEKRKFYLADVEAFVMPVAVIPDVGSEDKFRYFALSPRSEWCKTFKSWLDEAHHLDVMDAEE